MIRICGFIIVNPKFQNQDFDVKSYRFGINSKRLLDEVRLVKNVLSCIAFLMLALCGSPAFAEEKNDFFVLLTKNGNFGWAIQKQLDGSSKLSATSNASSPSFCIEDLSDGGLSSDVAIKGAFSRILNRYANAQTGRSDSFSYDCMYNQFLLVRRSAWDRTAANGYFVKGRSLNAGWSLLGVINLESLNSEIAAVNSDRASAEIARVAFNDGLGRNAQSDSKEKVYILTLVGWAPLYNRWGESTCTLERYRSDSNKDGLAIKALFGENSKLKDEDGRPWGTGTINFYVSSLQQLYNSYDANVGVFVQNSNSCVQYIDYAKNIQQLFAALKRDYPAQQIEIFQYDAKSMIAKFNGFEQYTEYSVAQNMGVNAYGYSLMKGFGVNSMTAFNEARQEMQSSGYSNSTNVDVLIRYLTDKRDGARIKQSALQVRDARNRETARIDAMNNARKEKCLRDKGFYATKNNAAKIAISNQCR